MCDNSSMAKKGRRATDEERVRVVQLLEDGYSAEAVADMLGVARSSVFSWQKKYREEGLAALSTKFASGRPTTLSDQQMIRLYSLIVGCDPRQFSFGVALWTRKLVGELIHRTFEVRLSFADSRADFEKIGNVTAAAAVPGLPAGPGKGPRVEARHVPDDPGAGRGGRCHDLFC